MKTSARPVRRMDWSAHVLSLFERARGLKDRLLSSADFQARAAAFPLTRFVARSRARDLFDLCAGFVYSQVLLACVELGLFDRLLAEPRTAEALAQVLRLPQESCNRLLAAAQSLRLVEKRSGGRYGLGPLGASLARNPALAAMIAHHRHLYADLRDPVALLRGGQAQTELGKYWAYAGSENPAALAAEEVAEYSTLMALSQPLVADEVLSTYPFDAHACLMDVGGGEGAFIAAAAKRAPSLRLMLFDLPAVAERAREKLRAEGLAHRCSVFSGDFFTDLLPPGADVITLVRIALDHDDEKVLKLLRSARAALPDNGVLVLAEPMSSPAASEPMGAAYFGLYLLAMGRGRPRTRGELAALLKAAGFSSVEFRKGRRVLGTGLAIAKR